MPCSGAGPHGPQYVGDPVDVTTGANIDGAFEFRLASAPTFVWRRHYNSGHHQWHRALGWGHTHEYDHALWLHVDGVRYTGPTGRPVEFGGGLAAGDAAESGAYTLMRVAERKYSLRHPASATEFVFEFRPQSLRAELTELRYGTGTLRFRYGPHGLEEIAHPAGSRVLVSTDERGRVRALRLGAPYGRDPRHLLTYDYDGAGNLIGGRDQYGSTFSFRYDAQNRMVRRTNRNGYSMVFAYDDQGRCTHAGGEDGVNAVSLRYNPLERWTAVTEADGGEWLYYYDEHGQVTTILNPMGGARRIIYDDAGHRVAELDPLGNETRYLQDGAGEAIAKVSPIGIVYDIDEPPPPSYRPHTLPESVQQYEYGEMVAAPARGRSAGLRNGRRHPDLTRLISEPLPTEIVTSRRDEFGKLLSQTTHSGVSRHWGYDANGNTIRYRDFSDAEYQVRYASWNHPVREVDPEGLAIDSRYTPTEKLAAIRDAGGTEHQYRYNLLGQFDAVYRLGELLETYEHDLAGNLVQKLDRAGNPLLRFEIASGNQIAARHLESGDVHKFEYDPEGRMLLAAANAGVVEFAYDDQGRRTKDVRDGRGVETRYDDAERQVEVLGRFAIRYHTRRDGTLRITDPTGATHTAAALAPGVMYRECANGSSEHTRFDTAGRVHAKIHHNRRSTDGHWVRRYRWSEDGDLLEADDSRSGVTRWTYDRAHRLRAATLPGGRSEEFGYDAAGNLLKAPGLSDVVLQTGNRLAWANGDRFQYDDRDHLAERVNPGGTHWYRYNSRGMLTRIERDGDVQWESTYDALSRRVSKTVGSGTTHYFWNTDQLAAEIDSVGRLRVYVYLDPLALAPFMFIDYASVDADPKSGAAYFVFANHLGAPLAVEDAAGQTVWRCTYTAYGSARIDAESRIGYSLRFPGHYFDVETGLHYNRFRYYSPELGRYLQCDPEGISGGLNLYAYTENPLVHVDIRGLNCGEHGKTSKTKPECEDCLDEVPVVRRALSPTEPGEITSPARLRAEVALRERILRAHLSAADSPNGRGPCFSMVLDQETGQAFPGINTKTRPPRFDPDNPSNEQLHPLLQNKVDNPPDGGWRNPNEPGAHSEIHALNQALWERERRRNTQPPGSLTDTSGLLIDNQRSGGKNPGRPMPCCPNCTHITGDVPSQAGKDPYGPGGPPPAAPAEEGGGGGPTSSSGVPGGDSTDTTGVPSGGTDGTGQPSGGGDS
jgi:RHS repeat-associated protein